MRELVLIASALISISSTVFAEDNSINGYIKKDGKYVQPHFRSRSDNYSENNYSARGNTNPYTGKKGNVLTPNITPKHRENTSKAPSLTPAWNNNKYHGSSYRKAPSGM